MASISSPEISVFDRHLIKQRRERATSDFSNHDFLFKWSKNQLSERLLDINRRFEKVLQIGSRSPLSNNHDKLENVFTLDITNHPVQDCGVTYIQATEEYLPVAGKSMDLVISNLNLHGVNDLPGGLHQIRQCLKPDGLFMASMLGGETLHELRDVMMRAEIDLFGGASPRIFPFADKLQMGELLQRAGFALPVVDSDIITVTYDNIFKLMHDLRGMGEGNSISQRSKNPVTKEFFMRVAQYYNEQFAESDSKIIASFEIIFLIGWSPHASQQKPLRPGSAEHSLTELLGTK